MSDQPYALRMADLNANCALAWKEGSEPHQFRMDTAAELRRQHSRIEADEALMRTAAEALEHIQSWFTEEQSGYADCAAAITALRKRLESSK